MLSEIFKAYDVRGIYGQNLTEDVANKIGRAFVHFLKCKDVVVGTDMRISSPKLSKAFMKGVAEQGANAIFIGLGIFAIGYKLKSAPKVRMEASPSVSTAKIKKLAAILPSDEKKIYNIVVDSQGFVFQNDLIEKSGLNKVTITRILDKLEAKGLVERRRRGMSNVIVLKHA